LVACGSWQLGHQVLVDVEAAGGVDDQHVAALSRARSSAQAAISTGSASVPLLVDVGAGALADR
jgi:hypothetical protein